MINVLCQSSVFIYGLAMAEFFFKIRLNWRCCLQQVYYFSNKGIDDINVSPDFLSDSDSSLSREKSSHAWSAEVMNPSELVTSPHT